MRKPKLTSSSKTNELKREKVIEAYNTLMSHKKPLNNIILILYTKVQNWFNVYLLNGTSSTLAWSYLSKHVFGTWNAKMLFLSILTDKLHCVWRLGIVGSLDFNTINLLKMLQQWQCFALCSPSAGHWGSSPKKKISLRDTSYYWKRHVRFIKWNENFRTGNAMQINRWDQGLKIQFNLDSSRSGRSKSLVCLIRKGTCVSWVRADEHVCSAEVASPATAQAECLPCCRLEMAANCCC
jgi:hypothetical protein